MIIRGRRNAGFTLLELLLVVGILSALALSATAFVDSRDDQQRFEETRHRLQAIRRAILGDESASMAQFVPGGFVAENGVLPPDLNSLLAAQPADWASRAVLSPIFDSTPDSITGQNNGTDEVKLSDGAAKLEKGWRTANLLSLPGSKGAFRDGWGSAQSEPDPNHGWKWLLASSALSITSRGKDNKLDGSSGAGTGPYDADMNDDITETNWGASIAGLKVYLVNRGSDIDASVARKIRVSLLVFENGSSGEKWKRYTSTGVDCLDNGDGKKGTTSDINPCLDVATLTFVGKGCDNPTVCDYSSNRVPLGRHLLLAINDSDGKAHELTAGDDEQPYGGSVTTVSGTKVSSTTNTLPILCTASGCPEATLVLR